MADRTARCLFLATEENEEDSSSDQRSSEKHTYGDTSHGSTCQSVLVAI